MVFLYLQVLRIMQGRRKYDFNITQMFIQYSFVNTVSWQVHLKAVLLACNHHWTIKHNFRFLPGVEDTVDVKQQITKGQKNEENNEDDRFVERCSFVTCTVSSTRRRSPTFFISLHVYQLSSLCKCSLLLLSYAIVFHYVDCTRTRFLTIEQFYCSCCVLFFVAAVTTAKQKKISR